MADVKVTLPRDDYNPNQRTDIDVEVVNPDGSTSTRTVKGAVQSTTEEDGTVTFGIMASAHVPFGGGSTYEDAILADSPLLYWRLGESSGTTATDASGNARHGTYTATPTYSETGALSGDSDTAVFFGTGDYVVIADAAWMDVDDFTIEAWVKTTGTGVSFIACREYDASSNRHFSLRMDANEKAELLVFNSAGSNASPSGTTTINDGNWHYLAGTWDGTTVRIYVDGSEENSAALSGSGRACAVDFLVSLRYDYGGNPGDDCVGTYDEIAFYDTALSSTRIAAHYSAGTA